MRALILLILCAAAWGEMPVTGRLLSLVDNCPVCGEELWDIDWQDAATDTISTTPLVLRLCAQCGSCEHKFCLTATPAEDSWGKWRLLSVIVTDSVGRCHRIQDYVSYSFPARVAARPLLPLDETAVYYDPPRRYIAVSDSVELHVSVRHMYWPDTYVRWPSCEVHPDSVVYPRGHDGTDHGTEMSVGLICPVLFEVDTTLRIHAERDVECLMPYGEVRTWAVKYDSVRFVHAPDTCWAVGYVHPVGPKEGR